MVRQAREDGLSHELQLAMWLHDTPEYVIGDLLPVVKRDVDIRPLVQEIELCQMFHICTDLKIPKSIRHLVSDPVVKLYDTAITAAEAITVAEVQDGWHPFDEMNVLHHAFRARIERAHSHRATPAHWCSAMVAEFKFLTKELDI